MELEVLEVEGLVAVVCVYLFDLLFLYIEIDLRTKGFSFAHD